jgi:glycosyltransferase involved in cell wall biosynthesis
MDRAERSLLAGLRGERRVIPNGVDLSVFRPGDSGAARSGLGLPEDAHVLAFVASDPRSNPYKDMDLLRRAMRRLGASERVDRTILLALGGDGPTERLGSVELRYVPFTPDPEAVAQLHRAADVYLHAARAETFPLAILEALACGTPVVATGVGGIPEQVRDLGDGQQTAAAEGPTGVLVPAGDPDALADAASMLLSNRSLREELGQAAAADARERFDLQRQVDAYIHWFDTLGSGPPSDETDEHGAD